MCDLTQQSMHHCSTASKLHPLVQKGSGRYSQAFETQCCISGYLTHFSFPFQIREKGYGIRIVLMDYTMLVGDQLL